jgi:hypothetical protein
VYVLFLPFPLPLFPPFSLPLFLSQPPLLYTPDAHHLTKTKTMASELAALRDEVLLKNSTLKKKERMNEELSTSTTTTKPRRKTNPMFSS